jgi:hypothetical protein
MDIQSLSNASWLQGHPDLRQQMRSELMRYYSRTTPICPSNCSDGADAITQKYQHLAAQREKISKANRSIG